MAEIILSILIEKIVEKSFNKLSYIYVKYKDDVIKKIIKNVFKKAFEKSGLKDIVVFLDKHVRSGHLKNEK